MKNFLIAVLLTLPMAAHAADATPSHLGAMNDRLNADDLQQLTRLAENIGGKPWLLVTGELRGSPAKTWYVDVYLEPDRVGDKVRRGYIMTAKAYLGFSPKFDRPKTWQPESKDPKPTRQYAQVLVPGAKPVTVTSLRDPNRPFSLNGTIDDDRLVSIQTYLRTSPKLELPENTRRKKNQPLIELQVQGGWPITSLSASDEVVRLVLGNPNPNSNIGQYIELLRLDDEWILQFLGRFVGD